MRSKPHIAAGPRSDPLPASDRRITVDHIDDQTGEATHGSPDQPATVGAPLSTPQRRKRLGRHRARHRARHRLRTVGAIRIVSLSALCTALLAVTVLGWVALHGGAAATVGSSDTAAHWSQERALRSGSQGNMAGFLGHFKRAGHLPAATTAPVAAPADLAAAPPLRPHEVFGFAPYWTLPSSAGFDVQGLTTLAYFSVGVNPDGTLLESGPGWNGYESQSLADLITRAHAADDRVVLTVTDFSQSSLNALTSSPTAASTLASALVSAVAAKNLDGVNLDLEGEGSADQAGLTHLVGTVSVSAAPGQCALSGDHGHLCEFGHRLGRLLQHLRVGSPRRCLLCHGVQPESVRQRRRPRRPSPVVSSLIRPPSTSTPPPSPPPRSSWACPISGSTGRRPTAR